MQRRTRCWRYCRACVATDKTDLQLAHDRRAHAFRVVLNGAVEMLLQLGATELELAQMFEGMAHNLLLEVDKRCQEERGDG